MFMNCSRFFQVSVARFVIFKWEMYLTEALFMSHFWHWWWAIFKLQVFKLALFVVSFDSKVHAKTSGYMHGCKLCAVGTSAFYAAD